MAYFKYKQVKHWILDELDSGRFTKGMKIPTESELMDFFHVSRKTIRAAIDELEENGILTRLQGSGTYVKEIPGIKSKPAAEKIPSREIALIMIDSSNYIFPDVLRGISHVLIENHYSMNVYFTGNDYDEEYRIIQKLIVNKPAGVIMEPLTLGALFINHAAYRKLAELVPVIMIHNDKPDIFTALSLHDRMGGRKITEYLLELGHRQIGTIFCLNESTAYGRYLGFLDAMRNCGQYHPDSFSIWPERQKLADLFEPAGNYQLEHMLNNVTAVICHDDRTAYSLISYLQRKGINVPENISVTGYDDSFFARLQISLTTITHPKEQYGKNAATALLSMIRGEKPPLSSLEIEPQLIIGNSTLPPLNMR